MYRPTLRLGVLCYALLLCVLCGRVSSVRAVSPADLMQQQALAAADGAAGDGYGGSVAIDGATAVVGAAGKNGGVVYIYIWNGATWTLQQEIAPQVPQGAQFGGAVALRGDTLAIGAAYYPHVNAPGQVYLYQRTGTLWSQQTVIPSVSGETLDAFGAALALDGETLAVGAPHEGGAQGAAYVFTQTSGVWSKQARLVANGGATDGFGHAVALHGDTVLVGAAGRNSYTGAVDAFGRNNGAWAMQTTLTPSDGAAGDQFGNAVAFDGATAVVGTRAKSAAYLFGLNSGVWQPFQKIIASDGAAGDAFGSAVTVANGVALVGAKAKNGGAGAAYVFAAHNGVWGQQQMFAASDSSASALFGAALATDGNSVIVGAPGKGGNTGGSYIFAAPAPPPAVATHLVFGLQPVGGQVGSPLAVQPSVIAEDAGGNTVPTYTGPVTLTLKGGAHLHGTTTVNAAGGVATFTDLAVDAVGAGYVLNATSGGLASADSVSFSITAPSATHLVFITQPGGVEAGQVFGSAPVLAAEDAQGAIATGYSGAVTLAIKTGTGAAGAGLRGTTTVQALNGMATFTDLAIDTLGTGYVLTATGDGLAGAESQPFAVAPGPPATLAFTAQPQTAQATQNLAPVAVGLFDGFGNSATNYTGNVQLAIKSGTGTSGAALHGTTTVQAVGGVATFTAVSLDTPGVGYILSATGDNLPATDSAAFTVLPAGSYVQMQLRVIPRDDPAQFVATLMLSNRTAAPLPAGTPITFGFAKIPFNPKDRTANTISGATWHSLTTKAGVAVLTTALGVGESRVLTLHLALTGTTNPTKLMVKATMPGKAAHSHLSSSNSVDGVGAGTVQPMVVQGALKAGPRAVLAFRGAFFANTEPLLITVAPAGEYAALPATADAKGGVKITTRKNLPPGHYTVQVYGWYSGVTGTGDLLLQ